MTECETLNPSEQYMATRGNEANGEGERDYVERVSSQKLSNFERFVVVGALVLLSFAGFAAHSDDTDPMTTSAIVTPAAAEDITVPHHQPYGHCREYSPYADKRC